MGCYGFRCRHYIAVASIYLVLHVVKQGNQARRAAKKQQEAKQDGIATERQRNLSKEQAKQDQTTMTASEPSEPLPQQ